MRVLAPSMTVEKGYALAVNEAYYSTLATRETGDTQDRWKITSEGTMYLGPGNATPDVNLYRSAAGVLQTTSSVSIYRTGSVGLVVDVDAGSNAAWFRTQGNTNTRLAIGSDGALAWGNGTDAPDVTLGRTSANVLTTADNFVAYSLNTDGGNITFNSSSTGGLNLQNASTNKWYLQNRTDATDELRITSGASKVAFRAYQATGYVKFDNPVGMAADPVAERILNIGGTIPGTGAYTYGIICATTAPATSTSATTAIYAQVRTAAAAFTVGGAYGVRILNPSLGTDSAITALYGLYIDKQTATGVANVYAIYQADTDDPNRFQGRVGIGALANVAYRLVVAGTHPSTAAGLFGIGVDYTLPATATATSSSVYARPPATTAASYTANFNIGVWVPGGAAPGAGSTINQRYGLYMDGQTGATINVTARLAASSTATLWVSADADNTTGAAGISFGSSRDTVVYRGGANNLATDDTFTAAPGTGNVALSAQAGNSSTGVTGAQVAFGYSNTAQYRHRITSMHHSSQAATNAIDFFMWNYGVDAVGDLGTKHVLQLDATVATFYTPVNLNAQGFYGASYIAIGSNTADTGALRLANSNYVAWRNNANNGNLTLTVDALDRLVTNASFHVGGTIYFGTGDVNIYKSAADTLKTDDSFVVGGGYLTLGASTLIAGESATAYNTVRFRAAAAGDTNVRFILDASGTMLWGPGNATQDTNLYRSAADTLKTDDNLVVGGTITIGSASSGWAVTNKTEDKTLDCNSVTLASLADNVGTLIDVLIAKGIITA